MADRLAPDLIAIDPRFGPLAEATRRLEAIPLDGLLTYLIDTAPAAYLPELARQFHIMPLEGWQFAATDAERRRLVREAIWLHRKKGTPWSIRRILALAGFGADAELLEGRIERRYDGAVFADGSEVYGGRSWAEFALDVDLGETAGLDGATPARIREIVAEWQPGRCRLTRLAFKAGARDDAPVAEQASTTAQWGGASSRPWRRHYDGALAYDQGRLLAYDGAALADGVARYQGWDAAGAAWLAGGPESDTTLALRWSDADRQQALPRYDGAAQADGRSSYGDAAPVAEDLPMPIFATRHARYDGRFSYGADNRFDGAAAANGSRRYFAGRVASGNESFCLEAA